MTTAINEITQNGVDELEDRSDLGADDRAPEQLLRRVRRARGPALGGAAGAELPVYVAPQAEIKITVKAIVPELLPTPSGPIPARRYSLAFNNPDGLLEASVTIDARGRLVRLEIPTARLALVRSDLATVATRSQPIRNPTDTDVIIPATGFNLAGTLTMPPGVGRLRHPAIVLVTGSGQIERDETVAGIPIFAQLAGSLAQEGFVVLRYDKRGIGQSGGRSERATLQDYADDLIAAVKWLAKRKDVDPRRIAVAGHSEGGAVAMLAAAREKKISALVLIAAPGTLGADLILEQQRHLLDVMQGARGGTAGEDRAAEAHPRGGDYRQGLGGDPAGAARAGGLAVVQEPAPVRPGEGDAEGQAADADRPGRSRHAGAAAPRRCPRASSRAPARKPAPVELVHLPGHQPPAGAGRRPARCRNTPC